MPPQLAQYNFSDVNFQVIIITIRSPWNTQLFTIITNQNANDTCEMADIWRMNDTRCILQQISIFSVMEEKIL